MAARPRPTKWKFPIVNSAPPKPRTSIAAVIISILAFVKSTLLSTIFLIPIDEIIPNRRIEIPPITGPGIVQIIEVNFGTKESTIANTAAILMIAGLKTPVRATAPVFSL